MYIFITMTFSLTVYTGNLLYTQQRNFPGFFFVKNNIGIIQMTDLGKIVLKSIWNKYSNTYEKY